MAWVRCGIQEQSILWSFSHILYSNKLLYTLYLYDACCNSEQGMHKQKGLVELIILDLLFAKFGIIEQKLLII